MFVICIAAAIIGCMVISCNSGICEQNVAEACMTDLAYKYSQN